MVTFLRDILPFDLFKQMLDEGVIRSQVHPLYPELVIFNYTEKAQFDRIWNAATNVCRGLIVVLQGPNRELHADCVVLARPFNKFHNLNTAYVPETLEENLPTAAPPRVTQKLDGSMGILYVWDHKLWIATRGSFDSDQARWATEWLRAHVAGWAYDPEPDYDCTPVFEIIYQENRIVVDYDFEGLVLLSLVGIANGIELHPNRIAAYAASKWGLNGLTYSVAEELRDYGIRVSAVAPGSVNTSFGSSKTTYASWKIQPEDVANVVAMLVTQSPQSFVSEVLLRPTRKP